MAESKENVGLESKDDLPITRRQRKGPYGRTPPGWAHRNSRAKDAFPTKPPHDGAVVSVEQRHGEDTGWWFDENVMDPEYKDPGLPTSPQKPEGSNRGVTPATLTNGSTPFPSMPGAA